MSHIFFDTSFWLDMCKMDNLAKTFALSFDFEGEEYLLYYLSDYGTYGSGSYPIRTSNGFALANIVRMNIELIPGDEIDLPVRKKLLEFAFDFQWDFDSGEAQSIDGYQGKSLKKHKDISYDKLEDMIMMCRLCGVPTNA